MDPGVSQHVMASGSCAMPVVGGNLQAAMPIPTSQHYVTVVPAPIPIPGSAAPPASAMGPMAAVPRVVPAPVAIPTNPGAASGDNRVTLWNRSTKRKIAGQAAPMQKNLGDYLSTHPDCELYNGQDARLTPEEKKALIAAQNRISIWNKATKRRISGNAAPTEKKLADYLRKHPECEVYAGQDKQPAGARGAYAAPPASRAQVGGAMGMPGMNFSMPQPVPGRGVPTSFAVPHPVTTATPMGGAMQSNGAGSWGQQLPPPMPIAAQNASIEDMYGDPIRPMSAPQDDELPIMAGSLEDMLTGMSLDELGTFSASQATSGSLGGDYNMFFGGDPSAPNAGSADRPAYQMSSAQRIKRDRTYSMSSPRNRGSFGGLEVGSLGSVGSSLAGSLLAHPAQRMRQGPGPGSMPVHPDLDDKWQVADMSPSSGIL